MEALLFFFRLCFEIFFARTTLVSIPGSATAGIKESDTGLAPPSQWDLVSDKQMMQEEQPLQVARCTKIISPNTDDAKYVINVKQIAKFVVGLGDKVSPTDIEEGMRVGCVPGSLYCSTIFDCI